jgi:diazepam-binding inhibitor (GABA receptor modulating acyl-CoA-binding protein)
MAFTGSLDDQFAQAQEAVKGLSSDPGNEAKLQLYALYKQATSGDASGKRPGFTDPVGRAKFDAWSKHKGTAQDAAKQQYIDTVAGLVG